MAISNSRQYLATMLLTILLSSLGFALLHFNLIGYGYTFFILVPLCIGFFLGQKPTWKTGFLFSLIIGLVAFFYLLVTAQLEGLFCVLTLSPLIILLVVIGAAVGYTIRQRLKRENQDNATFRLSLYPLLLLFASGTIEHYFSEQYDFGKVESRIFLPYPPGVVFDYIKSVDTLNTEKPVLLYLGLSVPRKCILDSEAVGANRICYFKEGTIDEKIVEIRRGEILKMNVVKYGLPGRRWLKFEEATYLFTAADSGTVLTRITTYRTELKPRFYWRFWEEQAIEAEHEYVLNDLKQRLDNNSHLNLKSAQYNDWQHSKSLRK